VGRLPDDHPQRHELNDEVHARPPEAIRAPTRISYIALLPVPGEPERGPQPVAELVRRSGIEPPPPGANHFRADLGAFRLKWERHTEFTRYTFFAAGGDEPDGFSEPALGVVPAEWIATLPGRLLVAHHVLVLPGDPGGVDGLAERYFDANPLIGAGVAGGKGLAFADFRIHEDGWGRMLVYDRGMTLRQTGRTVQRLLEIDTYRMLALMALPVARGLAPFLDECEGELVQIAELMTHADEDDEPVLLERLTRLASGIEGRHSETHFRLTAAAAYHELVKRRIAELREVRIEGLQTFQEFTERRLAPAMNTCRAVAERQGSVSERVQRATELLSIRVGLTREHQNQQVLASMNRRAKLQLRLQETVEGLSIAAVTYYVVGLVAYLARGLEGAGVAIDVPAVTALSVPAVAVLVAVAVRRVRKLVQAE